MRAKQSAIALLTLLWASCSPFLAAQAAPRCPATTFEQARPVLGSQTAGLPRALRDAGAAQSQTLWPSWVKQQDETIRQRLLRGDVDSIVNLLLYGADFTSQPRITKVWLESLSGSPSKGTADSQLSAVLGHRLDDFLAHLGSSRDVHMVFARNTLLKLGYGVGTQTKTAALRAFLLDNLQRVRQEFAAYSQKLAAAHDSGDMETELKVRGSLFAERGVSLDTRFQPDYALEETLREVQREQGLKHAAKIGIVGPGLDFVDKGEGYDLFPEQTLQPFAVMSSLVRLGLARPQEISVTTLDISERVNRHLWQARAAAQKGNSYSLNLAIDPAQPWKPGTLAYWKQFGAELGKPVAKPPMTVDGKQMDVRSLAVSPAWVLRIHPMDANIVYSRCAGQFDIIIGTNIFVYYGAFEQAMAESNAAAMLRPGGLLLSNDLLPDDPATGLEPLTAVVTEYSDRGSDGDQIFVYRKKAAAPDAAKRP